VTEQEQADIGELFRRYVAMVRGRALRILGNPALAEDVAQEVFIRYLKRRRAGKVEENTAGMLYRIATNLALNTLRDRKRRREILEGARHELQPEQAQGPEDLLTLRQILARVPKEEARIASYYYVDGMEQDEIATLLDMERRTVGRRLERFRERARKYLRRSERKVRS
jgi:RNA polymerase sigma-70 factor (ECF subfamily)